MRAHRFASHCLSLSAAVALVLSGTSDGAVLVHENFDYPTGALLNGEAGGKGFKGTGVGDSMMPWVENLGADPEAEYLSSIQSGNTVVPVGATSLDRSGNSLFVEATPVGREVFRPLAPIDISYERTLWMSVVMIRTVGFTGMNQFALYLSPTNTIVGGTEALVFGDLIEQNWYGLYGSGTSVYSSATVTTGTPVFLALKMTFNPEGKDRFDLFVDPAFGAEPSTPNATLTALDLSALNFLGITATGPSTGSQPRRWSLDEIRIADTYAEVTPTSVPEPTASLMGLVGAAALGFRRRRR